MKFQAEGVTGRTELTIDKFGNHRRCLGDGYRMASGRIEVESPQAMRYEMAEDLKRIAGNVRPNTYYSRI